MENTREFIVKWRSSNGSTWIEADTSKLPREVLLMLAQSCLEEANRTIPVKIDFR